MAIELCGFASSELERSHLGLLDSSEVSPVPHMPLILLVLSHVLRRYLPDLPLALQLAFVLDNRVTRQLCFHLVDLLLAHRTSLSIDKVPSCSE